MSSASQPGLSSFSLPLKVPSTLIPFNTRKYPQEYVEICVIGSGAAGLCAALEASKSKSVLVLTKSTLSESATVYAQGGIAVALGGKKDCESHIQDTVQAGQGLSDESIVKQIVSEGPERLKELLKLGTQFDTNVNESGQSELALTQEGGHSNRRILHAGGDATGKEIERALIDNARTSEFIRIYEETFVIDLLLDEDKVCRGVIALRNGQIFIVWANNVIIASGGVGQLFRETTNPKVSTGDGQAIAYRAGAVMQDMEFMQFHPTTLYIAGSTRVLVTEAVRGEGGILRNRLGHRYMPDYHPKAELAPRDIVSRASTNEMKKTQDTNVYLDVTHLDPQKLAQRFPSFVKTCEQFGINIKNEMVPVRPTAHYFIGGIKIDIDGKTSIDGLYAVGECASSRFHGANRLGSNSLLESVVTGIRAGIAAANDLGNFHQQQNQIIALGPTVHDLLETDVEDLRNAVQSLMWNMMGVVRDKTKLEKALVRLNYWMRYALSTVYSDPISWEMQNMLCIAAPMLESALQREESRGVHFRSDFPDKNDLFNKHTEIKQQ